MKSRPLQPSMNEYPMVEVGGPLFNSENGIRLERPTIEDTLMTVAFEWSKRGTCSRRRVGAVIADTRGVTISTGYNGALAGFPHCSPHNDYQPCEVSEHAERNAIYWAARRGVPIEGAILYCTDAPCVACARACIQSGIKKVIYSRPYREDQGLILLLAANIEVKQHGVQ